MKQFNIQFKKQINGSSSVMEDSLSLERLEKQITNLFSKEAQEYFKSSPFPLVVTLVLNPSDEDLEGAHMHNNRIYSIVCNELNSDKYLYVVRNKLVGMQLEDKNQMLLIAFGIEEFSGVNKLNHSDSETDDERPQYELKTPKWSFDDVLLNDDTKKRLLRALSIIENKDLIFNKWGFSKVDKSTKSIICFYGPAGTGKTMTSEAIGSYLGKKIVHSSYAQIESKWVGEGAKNLHAIFKFAEENDAVLFFDEADSFLSSRIESTESSSDKHYNRMSNELFQLLEDFNGCVIFSTNLLTDVDSAFKSRIIDSIKFELPDVKARYDLIKKMIPKEFPLAHTLSDDEINKLVEISDGFSGRDIRKSLLLSFAGAAIKYKTDETLSFVIDDLLGGFEEVKSYKEQIDAEAGILPTEVVSDIIENQKKNENLIDIAIYAMYSDGLLHDNEIKLIDDLSHALLKTGIEMPIQIPQRSVEDICKETHDEDDRKALMETVIRVVAIDGNVADEEMCFVEKVASLLDYGNEKTLKIKEYAIKMAELNKNWSDLSL